MIRINKHLFCVGGVLSGLGVHTDPLASLKPMPIGRALAREQDSPTAACNFPQTSSPTLQGISMPLMGGMMGADGLSAQGVSSQVNSLTSFCLFVYRREMGGYNKCFACLSGLHIGRSSQRRESASECLPQSKQRVSPR